MLKKNSIVLYKTFPAVVKEIDGDKFILYYCQSRATASGKKAVYGEQKVREKDVIVLCADGGSSSAEKIQRLLSFCDDALKDGSEVQTQIAELHELLADDVSSREKPVAFAEMVELLRGGMNSDECWGVYSALKASFQFAEKIDGGGIFFVPRTNEEIELLKKKAFEKDNADEIRGEFIARVRARKLKLPDDAKFMGDVEALALGKTDKSRTMRDLKISETPEKAHKLLLECGMWEITRNPYPIRWGLSMKSASESLGLPPDEERFLVAGEAYAIDNEWSGDPDDAIAFDGEYLWVHIADPASFVRPESSIDKSARARGATLYIPEGASRMLSEDSLEEYALGLKNPSRALSFKMKLDDNGDIVSCDVMKTLVNVKRLTYGQADELRDSRELAPLFSIAQRNFRRRCERGAVNIQLPEVHITVDGETKRVSIGGVPHPESAAVVREAMVLAGEGAARFAFKNNIPFPFISQESPEIPKELPEGMAGQFRLRKCMRRRNVSVTPSVHSGLGVGMYSQVTSPLRRYGDLISHEQLRAFLDGKKLIDKDDMLMRMGAGDAAAMAAKKAERNSNRHWTLVYLLQNPEWTGEAVCVEIQGKTSIFCIPEIGMETLIAGTKCALNETIRVKAGKIDLPNLECVFMPL
ncbi:MAG: RNB domain-containing ribonuclease [Treponema sp.]|nr:RNB domain-containing ribonuclease [Treponema sp.]